MKANMTWIWIFMDVGCRYYVYLNICPGVAEQARNTIFIVAYIETILESETPSHFKNGYQNHIFEALKKSENEYQMPLSPQSFQV